MKLEIRNLKKEFDGKVVLENTNFEFEKGKIYGLLGRNGAGKTTLFNCIAKECLFEDGEINLVDEFGSNVNDIEKNIGYVYSDTVLPEFLTGYEFIKFYVDINKDKIKNIKPVEEYLRFILIEEEDWYKLIKTYSYGMKNKIQMLCHLITRPEVILLDEPLASFDVIMALEIKKMLKDIKADHIIVFSTHILQLAVDLCDELVILKDGQLQLVDKSIMDDEDFEEKIMGLLKESCNV